MSTTRSRCRLRPLPTIPVPEIPRLAPVPPALHSPFASNVTRRGSQRTPCCQRSPWSGRQWRWTCPILPPKRQLLSPARTLLPSRRREDRLPVPRR